MVNPSYSNTSKCNVNKLQAVQNFACRIVSGARKFDHVTPIRKKLNWLSVPSQLYYRNATMAFKCMTGQAPEYLKKSQPNTSLALFSYVQTNQFAPYCLLETSSRCAELGRDVIHHPPDGLSDCARSSVL